MIFSSHPNAIAYLQVFKLELGLAARSKDPVMRRGMGGIEMFERSRVAAMMSAAVILSLTATSAMAAKIFVIGGKPDDPFWSIVKRGAEDAGIVAKAQGGSV